MAKEKQIMNQAIDQVKVTNYLSYREFLADLYSKVKPQIENYSYLRFADYLGFSMTNVIRLVIVGKRSLTSKAAQRISDSLYFKGPQRQFWENLVAYNNARLPDKRELFFAKMMTLKKRDEPFTLNDNQQEYFSEWYFSVIREILSLQDMAATPENIQNRLAFPLRLDQIKHALEMLLKMGAVAFDQVNHSYSLVEKNIVVDAGVDSIAIVRYHQKMIEVAKESITRIDESQREISAVTISLPSDQIPVVKGKIEELMQYLMTLENSNREAKNREVFQVNAQFFPFSKKDRGNE